MSLQMIEQNCSVTTNLPTNSEKRCQKWTWFVGEGASWPPLLALPGLSRMLARRRDVAFWRKTAICFGLTNSVRRCFPSSIGWFLESKSYENPKVYTNNKGGHWKPGRLYHLVGGKTSSGLPTWHWCVVPALLVVSMLTPFVIRFRQCGTHIPHAEMWRPRSSCKFLAAFSIRWCRWTCNPGPQPLQLVLAPDGRQEPRASEIRFNRVCALLRLFAYGQHEWLHQGKQAWTHVSL